jgi:Peptidase M15
MLSGLCIRRGFARRLAVAFATLATAAMFNAGSTAIAGDTWADAMIEAMKAEQNPTPRRGVRVASLSNDGDTSTAPTRTKRQASIAQSDEDRPQASKPKRTRVASIDRSTADDSTPTRRRSLSGGSITWLASSGCLNGTLRSVLADLSSNYGPITVNSTCRSRGHNARVGGAPRSQHLTGDAVDFRIHSNAGRAYASLRSNGSVGGLKHYGGGLFHIDTGERRSW